MDDRQEEVIARVSPSTGRRVLGIGMLSFLAVLVLYVAITTPPSLGWQLFLVALGAAALMIANAMRKSTRQTLELTRQELRDDKGTLIVRLEDVVSIDRGAFAFKPSNGFLVRTRKSGPRAWNPGLWWRMGRRIGVGGVTSAHQAKFMVEILTAMLLERDGEV